MKLKLTSREFQRSLARMKAKATAGEKVSVLLGGEKSVVHAVPPKTWQGALKGKARITGGLLSTGLGWETLSTTRASANGPVD